MKTSFDDKKPWLNGFACGAIGVGILLYAMGLFTGLYIGLSHR